MFGHRNRRKLGGGGHRALQQPEWDRRSNANCAKSLRCPPQDRLPTQHPPSSGSASATVSSIASDRTPRETRARLASLGTRSRGAGEGLIVSNPEPPSRTAGEGDP